MSIIDKVHSIKRPMIYINLVFVLIMILITAGVLSYIYVEQSKNELSVQLKQWANLVTLQSENLIDKYENDNISSQKELAFFNDVAMINFVYVYKLDDNNALLLAANYNKNSLSPSLYPNQEKILRLATPHVVNDSIELIQRVKDENDTLLGYVHIQSNLKSVAATIRYTIVSSVLLISITLLLSLFFISKFHHSLSNALGNIIQTIQLISQRKDYTLRCKPSEYKEIDVLGRTINIMLSRTEKFISRQKEHEQDVLRLNHSLEEKVNRRTDALKESNQELLSTLEKLHQFQGQLVENEKMASLGDMVAGIAHEVNTPVGLGVTASSLLADRLQEIQQAYDDKTLKGSQLKRFLHDSESNINIVIRNLNRAADLISSFKQVAVDQSNEETRYFNVKQFVNEVCLTLGPQLKETNYNITIDCDDALFANVKAGPLNQIFINLIMNSKIHGFNNAPEGDITITIMALSNQLNIIYQDNGVGIDNSVKSRVFEPFVTTKRGAGGSGLGLHLVYNLVTQALGGSIQLESTPGEGVTFEINIPI
ncbi:MAG: sensor histidine kinase [Thalassotalea sp.]